MKSLSVGLCLCGFVLFQSQTLHAQEPDSTAPPAESAEPAEAPQEDTLDAAPSDPKADPELAEEEPKAKEAQDSGPIANQGGDSTPTAPELALTSLIC